MTAYYNEIDPFAVQWLRSLIAEGLIAPGDVDDRPIQEVQASDLNGYTQVHFFAGIGGWSAALRLAAWSDDVSVWSGSCPCQPFSAAGKRQGERDERHLWPEFRRLIAECRPASVLGEQVASKDGRQWLARVRADLEELGYGVGAADLCAAGSGAPHIRQRLWWVADTDSPRLPRRSGERRHDEPQQPAAERTDGDAGFWSDAIWLPCTDGKSRRIKPRSFPLAHGLPRSVGPGSTREQRMELVAAKANRVGRLRGYGNAIVPQVAAEFVRTYMEWRELFRCVEGL